ncbi:fungal-specific transcription factor domain-containing protein [Lentinula aff. detonsa]|uniref:Fungal-specific transcription factor domain-containing protein n=1 Tax=Lentinula aff. detonsa TaxID=2804958 RepID=A0AA38NS23_9AGAR|nr:fungal-specific transcription factor domain-containing protein [Lentinula aff. detonsa]
MTKAQPVKRSSSNAGTRGKGTYASHACNVCKRKKIKCDENKPACGSCEASGRSEECAWSGESARKPRTEAHFEAMRRRADALERYANILESMLQKCQREHGGTFRDGQSYLQFRPKDYGDEKMEYEEIEGESGSSDGDDMTAEICVSAQSLTLDERDLVLYGNVAPFRFANTATTLPKHISIIPDVETDFGARYMLLVDGADQTYYDLKFDWSRYLPSQVPLDRKEHDRILDLLFKFFTSWCMRIVPVLFLRDMYRYLSVHRSQTPPKTSHYSPMLHNALLAVAAGFSDKPQVQEYKARKCFADEAKRLMESEVQRPNVSVVHALSMLGSFHSSSGEQGLGYVYFGIGSRVSQALGLNVDCSAWVKSGLITTHDMYDRNWAYWTTFTQEICWCLYVGRDSNLLTSSEESSIPVPYVDQRYDQILWEHPSANIAPQPNYLSTTFAATCELMTIARRVLGVVNSLHVSGHRREVKDEQISSIDLQLHAWKGQLSDEIDITLANKNTSTPHKLVLHMSFWWTFILLHRPFFLRRKRPDATSREIDHIKLCKRAADNIMDLLGIYRALYTLRYIPVTPVQIVFAAGTIYVLLAVQATTGLRVAKKELKTYIGRAELCIQYLMEIGRSFKCASDIAEILKGLIVTQLRPVLERKPIRGTSASKQDGKVELHPTTSASSINGDTMDISSSSGLPAFSSNSFAPTSFDEFMSFDTLSFPEASLLTLPSTLYSQPSSSYLAWSSAMLSSKTQAGRSNIAPADFFNSSDLTSTSIPTDPFLSTSSFALHGLPALDSSPSITSMETAGFLAMMNGESISHAPCIPPFITTEQTNYDGNDYGQYLLFAGD